jgi:predicted DNA-binding mobile mystery protein A
MTFETARAARRALDARLAGVDVDAMRPPRDGSWVRAIRESLMMSAAELGSRQGVSKQAVYALQASEVSGTIRLESLQRAAAALDCELVYALVPNTTLQGTVEAEAARIVDVLAASVAHSMALEGQAEPLSEASRADHVDDVIRSASLWRTDVG